MAATPAVARVLHDWLGAAPRSLFLLRGCVFYEAKLVLPLRKADGSLRCPVDDLSPWAPNALLTPCEVCLVISSLWAGGPTILMSCWRLLAPMPPAGCPWSTSVSGLLDACGRVLQAIGYHPWFASSSRTAVSVQKAIKPSS